MTERGGNFLEGQDLNVAIEAAMDLVETDQGTGRRVIALRPGTGLEATWASPRQMAPKPQPALHQPKTQGRHSSTWWTGPPSPRPTTDRSPSRPGGAASSPESPTLRYQGVARDPRALIESPIRGIGVMNALSEVARREIRFISSHMVDRHKV